jgi:hypothetical protein
MLSTEREEFLQRLRVLFAGLDKPLGEAKEDAFWKGLANMSLIEFGRCCDLVLEELVDRDRLVEFRKMFTPGDIWAAKQRLRVRAAARPTEPDSKRVWTGDAWDMRANRLLLAHLGDQARAGVHYCDEETRQGLRKAGEPSDESRALMAPLIAYKHAWAQDMRESADSEGRVPISVQMAAWRDCMQRANVEVDRIRAEYSPHREEWAA